MQDTKKFDFGCLFALSSLAMVALPLHDSMYSTDIHIRMPVIRLFCHAKYP